MTRLEQERGFADFYFGLVQAVDRFGQGVVERIARAAHRGGNAGLKQPFAVAQRQILRSPVAVVRERSFVGLACRQRLLQGIEHEVGGHTR